MLSNALSRSKRLAIVCLIGFLLWLPDALAHGHEAAPPEDEDLLTSLIETPDATPGVVFISVLIAGVFGAMHALSPGHGKTVVAAYLIGTRSTVKHALFLGLVVTLTHTFGVFLLGFVALFASRHILPEQLYPWLSVFSGCIVFLIGAVMFVTRLRGVFSKAARDQSGHAHSHDGQGGDHHDDPSHAHPHDAGEHHDHGHSHMPPGADGSPITWRSLLALGVSGGILPCPSALVLLLAGISLHRVGFGLVLILAFSIGLSTVLTGIGLLFVKARTLLNKLPVGGPVMRLLPSATALVIMVLGIAITAKALVQVM